MRKLMVFTLVILMAGSTIWATEEKISIYYEGNDQFEITCANGVRVLIDIFDPSRLSAPPTKDDILLTTHTATENCRGDFMDAFPGRQIKARAGEIGQDGLKVVAMDSKHKQTDSWGTNHIFLIETAGLKIIHTGDIGQEQWTGEQLALLSGVDIALTQFYNEYSMMDSVNFLGFSLMDRIRPKLVIPTNLDHETAKYAAAKWAGSYTDKPAITIGRSDLPQQTRIIFMGPRARLFGKICNVGRAEF